MCINKLIFFPFNKYLMYSTTPWSLTHYLLHPYCIDYCKPTHVDRSSTFFYFLSSTFFYFLSSTFFYFLSSTFFYFLSSTFFYFLSSTFFYFLSSTFFYFLSILCWLFFVHIESFHSDLILDWTPQVNSHINLKTTYDHY